MWNEIQDSIEKLILIKKLKQNRRKEKELARGVNKPTCEPYYHLNFIWEYDWNRVFLNFKFWFFF